MQQLTTYLDEILTWHTHLGSPVPALLQPGLTLAKIQGRAKQLPFQLSEEVLTLYQWRNGIPRAIESRGNLSFFEAHQFLPLDDALESFQIRYPIFKEFNERTDWLPLFEDVTGDGYGAMGAYGAEQATPVVFVFEGLDVDVVFDNLTNMMRTMLACFEEGVFWLGADQWLETDYDRLGNVARTLNHRVPYWQTYGGTG